ncbi:hypothetical protein Patl1_19057 [Pistacia atlantica]|uniref:Uncharacterized protein n=1 Tax=Pistacia atlantica TaxID=434234 RepID=A0ACC1C412_9ROSI|nr:hypothetical protein Patl1_19057 [Pistacia atlantica]
MTSFQFPSIKNKMKTPLGAYDVWEIVENGFIDSQDESAISVIQKETLKELRKERQERLFFSSIKH